MGIKGRRVICAVCAAAFAAAAALMLFAPFPQELPHSDEAYACAWEDGTATRETYESAYAALYGASEEGAVLERGGVYGVIACGDAYAAAYGALADGSLAELLSIGTEGIPRIGYAALWRGYSHTAWYAGEWFAWTQGGVTRVSDAGEAERAVLLSGTIAPSVLRDAGITELELRPEAEFSARTLAGTAVKRVTAQPPYASAGGVVYLDTAGGRRLAGAVPAAESLVVAPDAVFADEGALAACIRLREVKLPFVGSAASGSGGTFRGEFAHLFVSDGAYRVPETLVRIAVTGGTLVSHAFYACTGLEEIVACGVDADRISPTAFAGCPSLKRIHSPRLDIVTDGAFSCSAAPCGCYLFEKISPAGSAS